MSTTALGREIPRFTIPAITVLAVITLLYSVLVTRSVVAWIVAWGGLFAVALTLFAVYLLYRLVLAVEQIADGR